MANTPSDQRILIVDDAMENVEILGSILSDYKRSVALNGEKALKIAFGENKPDLILLDVMMPGMDGFEVCRRLKEEPSTKDIPVIFITAKSEVEDETRGLELGAVDFIPKPISAPVVLARVRNHLELKHSRMVLEQKNQELIGRNKYITDSINYAKRIQSAILPNEDKLKKIFPESFCLYKPKDIVSGDFYWFSEIENKKVFAVIDCTGHGVPGAFMSIIGNTLLNEIINLYKISDPAQILNLLDKRVISELQKDINVQTFDGMDAAVCVFDMRRNLLSVAGAYRPTYVIQNNQLTEIKGDRKSIGDSKKDISFTAVPVSITSPTEVYVFSDGITDQNNADDKKFSASRLKDSLLKVHCEEFGTQKEFIASEFEAHRGQEVQRDDVLLFGVRLHPVSEIKVLSYSGPISHENIISLGEDLNSRLQGMLNPKQVKHIFFCVNEFLQNIFNYSFETTSVGSSEFRVGALDVVIIGHNVEITAGNPALLTSCQRVREKINVYNSLDEEQLKKLKKEKLREATESTSKGGGIGFLEIIRRSRAPIDVTIEPLQNEINYLKLSIKINMGDSNE